MGGSSKKGAAAPMGPATAGGPTPTLTQAQAYYPNYASYYGQPTQQTPSNIGLSIPTDLISLRQAAANQPSPMLVNRSTFNPNAYIAMRSSPPSYQSNAIGMNFYNPARSYGPQPSYANAMPSTASYGAPSMQQASDYAAPRPVPVPTYVPQITLNPVNPEPPKPAEPVYHDPWNGQYDDWRNGSGGGGN